MKIFILYILFSFGNSFITNTNRIIFKKLNNKINLNMEYENFKNYDEIINFLPSFQASIIINNWLSYIENKENNDQNNFIKKSIYDMKFHIAINRENSSNILLAWNPDYTTKRSIAYIASCKIQNNILFIERIAQNPYYEDVLKLKSLDFFDEIKRIINTTDDINGFSLDKLNSYDNRFWLSILFYSND